MKILNLTLKKKWFDLIASGQKTVEYREDKPYWEKRLMDSSGQAVVFDEIHFRNGYSPLSPFMRVEWKGCCWVDFVPCPGNGEELDGPVFVISLGNVLEVRHHA